MTTQTSIENTGTASTSGSFAQAAGVAVPRGAAAGVAGGLVFGGMMHSMGMMPMIAMMVGSKSVALGWFLHLAISVFIGVTFAVAQQKFNFGALATVIGSTVYGAIWWVLGPLLLMPAALGMPLFMINDMTLNSLGGHVLFGAIAGVVLATINGVRGGQR